MSLTIKFPFKISDHKNKYIIVGDREPEKMLLPVVLDIQELSKFFDKLVKSVYPGMEAEAIIDAERANININIKKPRRSICLSTNSNVKSVKKSKK